MLLWDALLPELVGVRVIRFFEAAGLVVMARLVVGAPVVHYEPPLDAEERALLLRERIEGEGSLDLVVIDGEVEP